MSSHREPMWFCHQCHSEMRPLMIPEPRCASCRGTFVEMMDDPSDDPRYGGLPSPTSFLNPPDDLHGRHSGDGRPTVAGGMPNILDALSNMFTSSVPRDRDAPDQSRGVYGSGGLRLVINTPSGTRTVRFGGSNTLGPGSQGGSRDQEGNAPLLSEFLASTGDSSRSSSNESHQTLRAPAPLLASYLLSNLFGRDGQGGMGMFDPFEMLAGGRYGDYVINEQALQNILNELMANGGSQPTDPPASEEVIDNLPRVVLEQGHPLANDSCSICHEPFNPALAASPDAFSSTSKPDAKEEDPSLVGVTLPCNHTFHEDCILPWMRMKSTCPVCRKSVLPASQTSNGSPRDGPSGGGGGSGRSDPEESGSYIPGAWETLD